MTELCCAGGAAGAVPGAALDARQELKITTWNILNPAIPPDKMFPFIGEDVWGQDNRRPIIQRRMWELGSDIFLLQEVKLSELNLLLQSGDRPLQADYESHFVEERPHLLPQPSSAKSSSSSSTTVSAGDAQLVPPSEDANMRGVAVLWKKGFMSGVERLVEGAQATDKGPQDLSNPAAFVRGRLACGTEFLFASRHLDALGCPPAVMRCQEEILQIGEDVAEVIGRDSSGVVVFGGDCNMCTSPAVSGMRSVGYQVVTPESGPATCHSVISSAPFDHIFVRGPWEKQDVEIPECPESHCCSKTPCMHQLQLANDSLGLSKPKVPGIGLRILGCVICPLWFLGALCCFLIPMPFSVKRCRWALKEYGSDHVPVTVVLRRKASADKR